MFRRRCKKTDIETTLYKINEVFIRRFLMIASYDGIYSRIQRLLSLLCTITNKDISCEKLFYKTLLT